MAKSKAMTVRKTVYVKAKNRRKSANGFHIPVGIVAGFAPMIAGTLGEVAGGGMSRLGHVPLRDLTGFDSDFGKFDSKALVKGWTPIILGIVAHKFIGGRLGVNRALARAGVPLFRI